MKTRELSKFKTLYVKAIGLILISMAIFLLTDRPDLGRDRYRFDPCNIYTPRNNLGWVLTSLTQNDKTVFANALKSNEENNSFSYRINNYEPQFKKSAKIWPNSLNRNSMTVNPPPNWAFLYNRVGGNLYYRFPTTFCGNYLLNLSPCELSYFDVYH